MSEPLLVDVAGDLVRLTLNDPQRANALSPQLASALTREFRRDWRAEGVRAILLAGAGRHFCAGADLENLRRLADATPLDHRLDSQRLRDLFEAILRQPALTIAEVQGSCVAGGCGLATACDFVVAAEDARFLYSEVRIGFVAALVATFLTLRLRGREVRELLLFPEFVDAPRALELGLVDRVVPADRLRPATEELAGRILANGSSESIALTKQVLLEVVGRGLDERLDLAAALNAASRSTPDCRHGVAHFLETKTPPRWRE